MVPAMKTLLALCLTAALFSAPVSAADAWGQDYAKALEQAKTENKPVLLDFTGSDWCGWCIKLEKEVFSTTKFKHYAKAKLVLVKVDFPRKTTLPAEIAEQNKKLAEQYGIQGFPTIVVLNSEGKKIGELGYTPGGPKAFIDELEKVTKQ